jgi:hypothetical protein
MILCQSWGYNGFKRKYRCNVRFFIDLKLCLENELFDKYRSIIINTHETVNYRPANFKDHFVQWDKFLRENIENLVNADKQFIELTGFENCILKKAVKCLLKDFEKTGRYHKRFTEGGWNPIDMHNVDDFLHEKMKKKEEKGGYK